ncbi:DUF58 domain-containing protein [Candidatus Woesearchaeota archaeon]|nr:DUF58 domain-containing protein [Candidatus Woesearchaeota archaeon]MBW3014356.1 DUF58 domain-containing protein [Candidatus Woesearchaeota archaeon]
MISDDFLDQLNRFNLVIQKRVTSNYVGTRESVAMGHGLTFEDHQQYTPGDDYRRIDWKVYGRTDKLHVRRFEEERSLTIHILTDASASMKFKKKWDYASMLTVGFAYLTLRENEKFQLSTFAEEINSFRPKRGRAHLAQMIEILNNMKVEGKTDLIRAARTVKKSIFSRSMIVVISDFLYPLEDIETALALLGKNDLKIIMLLDEKEYDLDFRGEYKLIDSENKSMLKTFISQRLRSGYKQKLDKHIADVKRIVQALGGEFHLVTTGMSIFDAFWEILREKKARGK